MEHIKRYENGGVRLFSVDKEMVIDRLIAVSEEFFGRLGDVERVYLFGSYANGIPLPGSDIDLLVIISESDLPAIERPSRFTPPSLPVGVDVIVLTLSELEQKLGEGSKFVREAISGKLIFKRE